MPWKRVDVDERRWQFVVQAASGKEPMTALCREFGISRPTGYLWRKRYREAGSFAAVRERSRRPQRSPMRTAAWKQSRVVALREEAGRGAKKLQVLLRDEEAIAMPVRTIHRILERCGLVDENVHTPAPQRFERAAPTELWRMDTKGKYPLPHHPLSIVDDHSRCWPKFAATTTSDGRMKRCRCGDQRNGIDPAPEPTSNVRRSGNIRTGVK